MATILITDAEMLALALAGEALEGIGSDVRDLHREAASDWVRGRLSPRYSSMLTTAAVSTECKQHIANRAAFTLLGRRGFNPSKGSEAQIAARMQDTVNWIDDVLHYRAELVDGADLDRGGPLVGGGGTSDWQDWRHK